MIEIWAESSRFNMTSQRFSDEAGIIKKGHFSDLEILEIGEQVNSEEYEQDPPTWLETLNTLKNI